MQRTMQRPVQRPMQQCTMQCTMQRLMQCTVQYRHLRARPHRAVVWQPHGKVAKAQKSDVDLPVARSVNAHGVRKAVACAVTRREAWGEARREVCRVVPWYGKESDGWRAGKTGVGLTCSVDWPCRLERVKRAIAVLVDPHRVCDTVPSTVNHHRCPCRPCRTLHRLWRRRRRRPRRLR